jgi:hypothetical protein
MKIKIRAGINMKKFNAIEQTIFAVVMDGCASIKEIDKMFYVFDKKIVAKAICRLVNSQLVIPNLPQRTLQIAPAVYAVFSQCEKNEFELKKTPAIVQAFSSSEGTVLFKSREENKALTNYLLELLFPKINISYYADYLIFTLHDIKGQPDE